MRISVRTLWVLLVLVVLATGAFAQTTGTIRGIATDQDGSPLPGVTITVEVPDRGTSRTAVTGESGRFAFPALAVDFQRNQHGGALPNFSVQVVTT